MTILLEREQSNRQPEPTPQDLDNPPVFKYSPKCSFTTSLFGDSTISFCPPATLWMPLDPFVKRLAF